MTEKTKTVKLKRVSTRNSSDDHIISGEIIFGGDFSEPTDPNVVAKMINLIEETDANIVQQTVYEPYFHKLQKIDSQNSKEEIWQFIIIQPYFELDDEE